MLVILVLVYLFFMITTGGNIFKPANFKALIDQNAYVYILGVGMLMCMLTGGNIDLSCGSFVCLLGALGGLMMVNAGMSTGLAIVLMLLIGIAYGCLLGYLIAYINIPPWIATLAGYLAFRGLGTSILSNSSNTGSISIGTKSDFLTIFTGKIFGTKPKVFNWPCMIAGIAAAVITVLVIFSSRAQNSARDMRRILSSGGGQECAFLLPRSCSSCGSLPMRAASRPRSSGSL